MNYAACTMGDERLINSLMLMAVEEAIIVMIRETNLHIFVDNLI